MAEEDQDRHSKALEAELVTDPDEQAKAEAANGVKQFDAVAELIEHFSDPERKFKLRPSHISFDELRERLNQVKDFVRFLKPDFLEEISDACDLEQA